MIVCLRTVRVPHQERSRFLAWIVENRALRQDHGILFEVVLERSPRQNPARTRQPSPPSPAAEEDLIVIMAWASHEAFDAWIDTPNRDRLTVSDVHSSVEYGPITRYDVAGGYLNLDGLHAVSDPVKEEP
jgi:hypothetical protein